MRKGFTLLELLAVVAIMGMLGVAAAASYGALTNGMKDRGTCAAATALLRGAKERARIDRMPTVVYCYNVCIRESKHQDDSSIVVGRMTAIRRVGRISYIRDRFLFDEFADLEKSYARTNDENELGQTRGHRLFKYNDERSVGKKMEYSIVADDVYSDDEMQMVTTFSGGVNNRTNILLSAFYDLGTSDRSPSGGWKIGDGYAAEFAELDLPEGYVFGSSALPRKEGQISEFEAICFDPDEDANKKVEIYVTRPNAQGHPQAVRKAGEATTDDSKGV
jgi:prepilin-type N-terminal cleavage/methylation domain-containing protein